MKDKLDYKECLKEFKKSLICGSEFDILIKGIIENISTNRIRWFDVGIGDGHYLRKIVDALEKRGFIVEVTGIDICEKAIKEAQKKFPEGKIIQGNFLKETLQKKYDVFSFNQTLYYFHNKNLVMEKCLKNLAEGGLVICVCWSKKDKIFQFHQAVFGEWTLGAFSSENFKELISKYTDLKVVYDELFKGRVNFKLWKDPNNLKKNLYVISRIPVSEGISDGNQKLAKELIKQQKNKDIRMNGILIAKKSYNILNFNRKEINLLLKERFPNYVKKIPKIKGDLEALFMGSWEKETEYISDYMNSGKVLEICCGVGLKSVILAKKHKVVAVDINQNRLNAAKDNASLFNVEKKIVFKKVDAEKIEELKKLGSFDVIYIDVDWRENLSNPIKKQNINPFKTCPRTDKLYKNLRKLFPEIPIIFKISPFVRIKDLIKLDTCVIEELYVDGRFLSYNVYFDPKIKKNRWQEIHLFNKNKI